MLQFGTNITKPGDPLQKITVERLFFGISKPKQQFRDRIEQLRMVKSMDEKQYRELKKQLPYFVCGVFHPKIRRTEHFAAIEYLILDLDHLEEAELDKRVLAERLAQLPEVHLLFTSPSEDGLKVLFKLKEPCKDAAMFSSFYKLFAQRFATTHHLEQVLDFKTSDVTRTCFLSYDPNAYYNPEPLEIEMEAFLPDLNFDQAEKDLKEAEQFVKKNQVASKKKDENSLSEEVLGRIKEKLNPHYRKPKKKNYFVPPEVDQALPELEEKLLEFEMEVLETHPISYGRKIKLACNELWAEINIFYGKNGFRVVRTTKSGSNTELATLAVQVLEQILATLKTKEE